VSTQRPPPDWATIDLVVEGPFDRSQIEEFCDRLRRALEWSGADVAVFDVGALGDPDGGTVDALARAQLTARRLGCRITLRHAGGRLQELLDLAGLRDVLRVEAVGEAEQREQALGVEEEGDPAEPIT
jgi:ABC-type transporter Mla MlaB component